MSREQVDERLRQGVKRDSLSEAETEALWQRIETGLAEESRPAAVGRTRRGWLPGRSVVVGAGLAATLLVAVVALGPWVRSEGDDGSLNLASLGSASAAQVFDATAEVTRKQSFFPGPSQVLYNRVVLVSGNGQDEPMEPEPMESGATGASWDGTETWVGANGHGVAKHDITLWLSDREEEKAFSQTMRINTNRPGSGLVMFAESWWSILTMEELKAMPADPGKALDVVRRAVSARAVKNMDSAEVKALGEDFVVLIALSNLLMQAPLTGEQRATLYEILASAPDWFRGGSDEPKVTNEGRTETEAGDEGILITTAFELSEAEAKESGLDDRDTRFEILLDPVVGNVLETRIRVGGQEGLLVRFVAEALELRDRADMPTPTRAAEMFRD